MTKIFNKIMFGVGKKPWIFVFRQLYRLVVLIPFVLAVSLVEIVVSFFKKKITADDTCFVVSSIIYPKNKPLSYGVRSIFDTTKRAEQTKLTIESIRKYQPLARIILVEGGMTGEIPKEIIDSVDSYLYMGKSKLVRFACDSRFKSLGETVLLLSAYSKIPNASRYFKISGRYCLNEEFKAENWLGKNFSFHYIRPDFISTRLYSFSGNMKVKWLFALVKGLPYLLLDYPVEYLLQKFVNKNLVSPVGRVGISGFDGVTGAVIKE